ncbi:phage integrase [Vibrio splendidus]|uniref:phage integrase n=1 Tax=Vibrio splendidus TaxID=29497 RepID=UPI003D6663A8
MPDLVELWFKLHGKNLKSGEHAKNRMLHICDELHTPIASHLSSQDFSHYRKTESTKTQAVKIAFLLDQRVEANSIKSIEPIKSAKSEVFFPTRRARMVENTDGLGFCGQLPFTTS